MRIVPPLNEGNILSIGDDLSGGSIKKTSPNSISKLLPLKTIINTSIVISYIIELQHLKRGLRVITSNMQTSIRLNLS